VRKFPFVLAGVVLAVATLTACIGGPPPPPPTDPHDVLVVGDSVSFSLGCVLGAPGADHTTSECPARSGYTTRNEYLGACTISQGTLLLYNSWTVDQPNCHDWQTGWTNLAAYYTPTVVVINTGAWETVDRWTPDVGGLPGGCPPDNAFNCPAPDFQWGGPTNGSGYSQAKDWYTSSLYNAITMFRSRGAKVLVANSVYAAGDRPVPDDVPDPCPANPITCHAFWEPFAASPPVNGQPNPYDDAQPPVNYTASWQKPNNSVSYRSGKAKIDQFNDSIQWVKDTYFASDNGVVLFNTWKHFEPQGVYKDHVCPPPNDATETPSWNGSAYVCNAGPAVLARAPDHGHLSPDGQFSILQPYLEPCVKALIPVAGGDQSKCS
jgi:hypothetical protein